MPSHELIYFLNFQFMAQEIQMLRDCLTTSCLPITSLLGQDKSFFIRHLCWIFYQNHKKYWILSLCFQASDECDGRCHCQVQIKTFTTHWCGEVPFPFFQKSQLKLHIPCYFNAIQRYIPEQILILSLKNEFWIFSK